jgi:4-amino-4-deoxy-L-arabinose transferase-like glycosyltransferase
MDFIHPRMSQFISDDGLDLAEFPIVYYISAIGYEIFGFHEFIPRLVSLFIVCFGLLCLYQLLVAILGDIFFSLILSLLLFTSPVLIFYSITPIPDTVAIALSPLTGVGQIAHI